jgi:hypothetical protein
MARITKTETTAAEATKAEVRPATFNLEDPALQAIIAQAVAVALAQQKAEAVSVMTAMGSGGKSAKSAENERKTIAAFKAKGFGVVVPRKDVLTFRRWVELGYRPVEGSKSIKVANLRLFHRSQVRQLSVEEIQAMQAQSDAAVARHMADVIPIGEANPQ